MKLFSALFQSFVDHRREKKISALYREYNGLMREGRAELASAVMRDIKHEIEQRSLRMWARDRQRKEKRMDPHAQAVLRQESRA